ncbi:9463_t:CDS:2, partial [Racocetra fulgida]
YDDATSTDNEDINITSQVSLSDNESDNGIISPQVSSSAYENNKAILPHSVSSIHKNNEATSSHPVSSVHKNDVSLLQGNDIALPAHRNDSEIITNLKIFVQQVVKTVLVAQDNHKDMQNAIRKCDEYTIDLEIPTKIGI